MLGEPHLHRLVDHLLPCVANPVGKDEITPGVDEESAIDESEQVGGHALPQDDLVAATPLSAHRKPERCAGVGPVDGQWEFNRGDGRLEVESPQSVGNEDGSTATSTHLTESHAWLDVESMTRLCENAFRRRERG